MTKVMLDVSSDMTVRPYTRFSVVERTESNLLVLPHDGVKGGGGLNYIHSIHYFLSMELTYSWAACEP